ARPQGDRPATTGGPPCLFGNFRAGSGTGRSYGLVDHPPLTLLHLAHSGRTGDDHGGGSVGPPSMRTRSAALGRRAGLCLRQASTRPRSWRGTFGNPSGPSTPPAANDSVAAHENTSVAG